jgi:energy-coupling factor transporter ATP-binding protein EcfA2
MPQRTADSHDLIRVQGARENNLKNVSIELPKRRLTVFTGVSGSGKSSLVFGTIAAESQRLINETYSAFVQGFMPTLARPEVDLLDGLTTAIIVDQERIGANPRSTVGTVTDANALLRILFSRVGQPHIGPPNAFSFNVPSASGGGSVTVKRGEKTIAEKASFNILGGMCPRCPLRREQVAQRGRAAGARLLDGGLVRADLPELRLLRPGQADQELHPAAVARPAL